MMRKGQEKKSTWNKGDTEKRRDNSEKRNFQFKYGIYMLISNVERCFVGLKYLVENLDDISMSKTNLRYVVCIITGAIKQRDTFRVMPHITY